MILALGGERWIFHPATPPTIAYIHSNSKMVTG